MGGEKAMASTMLGWRWVGAITNKDPKAFSIIGFFDFNFTESCWILRRPVSKFASKFFW